MSVTDSIKDLATKAAAAVVSSVIRSEKDYLYNTPTDFEHTDGFRPRLIVCGCTGAGKSTMLNVMAGWKFEQVKVTEDGKTKYRNKCYKKKVVKGVDIPEAPPIFTTSTSTSSCTKDTAFALVDYFGDVDRPLMLIDTPGADDTEGAEGMRMIEADLINKMQKLGYVNAILVIHNDIKGNRLNPATLELLEAVATRFQEDSESDVWSHVVIGYSKCNLHETDWRSDLEEKIKDMQAEIKKKIPSCNIDLPVLCFGGLKVPGKADEGDAEENSGYEKLYKFVRDAGKLSTQKLEAFKGVHVQCEDAVLAKDAALQLARMHQVYMAVILKLLLLFLFFFVRNGILPWWLAFFLFQFPTILDEVAIIGGFCWLVGPRDIIGSCQVFYSNYAPDSVKEHVKKIHTAVQPYILKLKKAKSGKKD